MYTTVIARNEKYQDLTDLVMLSRPVSQTSYSRSIPYSAKADTINGTTVLIDPTTEIFTNASGLNKLKGMYIDLNGAIYFLPTDTVFSQVNIGNGTVVTSYSIQASKARRMYTIGFRVAPGAGPGNRLRKCDINGISNDADDLMLGSVCASWIEATIHSTEGDFAAYEGDELTVYKVAPDGTENQIGVFNITEAKWISKRVYKITAYDNVIKLDRDITGWLRGLTEWPYEIKVFYGMLCDECGVDYYPIGDDSGSWVKDSTFMVHKFDVEDGTTGRQLMGTICEVMGDYCIAKPDGKLSAGWYRTTYVELYPRKSLVDTDDPREQFYLSGTLSNGDFDVEDVKYVQIQEDRSKDAVRWPDYGPDADVSNAYIITGNPILMAHPTYKTDDSGTDTVRDALTQIAARFDYTRYRPFKVTIPELLEAQVGKYAFIQGDTRGAPRFIAPITNITWKGNRMTLECTARRTRSTADSPETLSNRQLLEEAGTTSAKQVEVVTTSAQPVSVPVQRVVDAGRRPRAMVSFTDDDCRKEVYENIIDGVDHGLFKLIKDTGIPYILACPPGNIGNNNYMTKSQLLEMHRAGVEISCHTWKESNMTEYASAEALDDDLSDCMAMYRQWGIKGVEAYAYCQGVYEDDYMGAVKNHFRMGFTVTKGINQIPYESYYMKRVEVFPKDGSNSLDDVKAYVDQVEREGGWLILMTHAWYESFDSATLRDDLIPYIRSKGVEIVSVSEAIRTTGNVVDTGIFRKPLADAVRPYFVVDAQGRAWANKLEMMTLPAGHENVELDLQLGKLLNLDDGASGGTTVTPASKDPAFRVCMPVDIRGCKSVIVSGWAYGGYGIVSFRDASKNVIECYYSGADTVYADGTYFDHVEIQVPEGATAVALAGNLYKRLPTLTKVYEMDSLRTAGQTAETAINELYTMMRVLDGSATTKELLPEARDDTWISGTSGKILGDQGNYPGVRITSYGWAVVPGEMYLVSCSASNGRGLYTILDADRNPVTFRPAANTEDGTILTDYMVTIPAQGAQIVLAADKNIEGVEGFALKKVTGW